MSPLSGRLHVRPTRSSAGQESLPISTATRVTYATLDDDARLSLYKDPPTPIVAIKLAQIPLSSYNAVRTRPDAPWEIELTASRTMANDGGSSMSVTGSSWKLSGLLRRKGSDQAMDAAASTKFKHKPKALTGSSSSRSIAGLASVREATVPMRPSTANASLQKSVEVPPLVLVFETQAAQMLWAEALRTAVEAPKAIPRKSSMTSSNSLPSLRLPTPSESAAVDRLRKPSPLMRSTAWSQEVNEALVSPASRSDGGRTEPVRANSQETPRSLVPQWIRDVRSASLDAPSHGLAIKQKKSANSLSNDGSSTTSTVSPPARSISSMWTTVEKETIKEEPARSRKASQGRSLRSSRSGSSVSSSTTSDAPTSSCSSAHGPPTPLMQPISLEGTSFKGSRLYGTASSTSSTSSTRSAREMATLMAESQQRVMEHIVDPNQLISMMRICDGSHSTPTGRLSHPFLPTTGPTASSRKSTLSSEGDSTSTWRSSTSPQERRITISSPREATKTSPALFLPAYRPRAALKHSPSGPIPPPLPSPIPSIRRSTTTVDLDAFGGASSPVISPARRLSRVDSCGSEGLDESEWARNGRESEVTVRGA